jgi:hypothetical protein
MNDLPQLPQTPNEFIPYAICIVVGFIIRFFEKRKLKNKL